MRLYSNVMEAVREVERDLWEMGIDVHPETMQDKQVASDPNYLTREVRHYGFTIIGPRVEDEGAMVDYLIPKDTAPSVMKYIEAEFQDRTCGRQLNPGNAWKTRPDVWTEFLHDNRFAYTYSDRLAPQLPTIIDTLIRNPNSRQCILNLHSNIMPQPDPSQRERFGITHTAASQDLRNMGGNGRIPCSLYYQLLIREGQLHMVYAMRSCDFLVHFPVDIALAIRLLHFIHATIKPHGVAKKGVGSFTYFTGSLHAYAKDMKVRGIF